MEESSDAVDSVNSERFSGDVTTEGDVSDMLANMEDH